MRLFTDLATYATQWNSVGFSVHNDFTGTSESEQGNRFAAKSAVQVELTDDFI